MALIPRRRSAATAAAAGFLLFATAAARSARIETETTAISAPQTAATAGIEPLPLLPLASPLSVAGAVELPAQTATAGEIPSAAPSAVLAEPKGAAAAGPAATAHQGESPTEDLNAVAQGRLEFDLARQNAKEDAPFRAIVPTVSREQLTADLAAHPDAASQRRLLGRGSEADAGVHAVAERTPGAPQFYVEKIFDSEEVRANGLAGLESAREAKRRGVLAGFDVVDTLSAPPGASKARLSFTEGLDVALLQRESKTNPAYAKIAAKYAAAVKTAYAAAGRAGLRAEYNESSQSLYVYADEAPPPGRLRKLLFQVIPQNVVATPDGRFVLVDPF